MKRLGLKWIMLFAVMPLVIVLDQLTKAQILERFRLGESVPVFNSFFAITYVQNTGAAFGLLAGAHPAFRVPFFIMVPLVALAAIAIVFRKIAASDLKLSAALSLVVGGAVGNLIDRVRLGFVVDFLDFHLNYRAHFPAFNVADSAICVGVGLLMLDLVIEKPEGKLNVSASL